MMRVAWGLYAALGLFWLWVAWVPTSGPLLDRVAIGNMVQVTIGLFLLSAGAATGLAEERVRGSLDVLLSTPMATRSILAGKWWGSFRRVLNVAIWPAATSIVLLREGGSWWSYLVLLGLVFAYGAAISSLGLALATWVSRLGRAVALCITIHVAWMVGWPFAVAFLVGTPAMRYIGMMIGDPPAGMLFGTFAVLETNLPRPPGVSDLDGLLVGDDRLDRRHLRVRGRPVRGDGRHVRRLPGPGLRRRRPPDLEPAEAAALVDRRAAGPGAFRPGA